MTIVSRKVVSILDGDTFRVSRAIGKFNKVRLANVNAPPKNTLGGKKATNLLRRLIGNKTVKINTVSTSYDRVVSWVYYGGRNINKFMKEAGF